MKAQWSTTTPMQPTPTQVTSTPACPYGRCLAAESTERLMWPIWIYASGTLALTLWQAILYLKERRRLRKGFGKATLFVAFLSALQLAHYVGASLSSQYYMKHPKSAHSPSLSPSWPHIALTITMILSLSMYLVKILSVHGLRIVYNEPRLFENDKTCTILMYSVLAYALFWSTSSIYQAVMDLPSSPVAHIIAATVDTDIWFSPTYPIYASQIDQMMNRNVAEFQSSRGLERISLFAWRIYFARFAWFYWLLFAIPVPDRLSSYPRFFISLTLTELSGNLFPAMLIYMLRKYQSASASGSLDRADEKEEVETKIGQSSHEKEDIEAKYTEEKEKSAPLDC